RLQTEYRSGNIRREWNSLSDCRSTASYGSDAGCGVIAVDLNQTVIASCNRSSRDDASGTKSLVRCSSQRNGDADAVRIRCEIPINKLTVSDRCRGIRVVRDDKDLFR